MAKAGRGADQFPLRLPEGLRDRIKRHAEENGRSMNSEIISLLETALWEADMSRMQAGLEPLREIKDRDWEIINSARSQAARLDEEYRTAPVDTDVPFFDEEDRPKENDIDAGFLILPEGITQKDFTDALVRANRKAFSLALKDLGIVQKPFPDDNSEAGDE